MQAVQILAANSEFTEVPPNPNPGNRIPRIPDQLCYTDDLLAIREGQEDTTRCNKTPQISLNLSTGTSHIHRESCSNLQSTSEGTQLGHIGEQPIRVLRQIQHPDSSFQNQKLKVMSILIMDR